MRKFRSHGPSSQLSHYPVSSPYLPTSLFICYQRLVHGITKGSSGHHLLGGPSPPSSLRGDSPPRTGQSAMPVVMEDALSEVEQPGLGMPSDSSAVAAVGRAVPRRLALGEMSAGVETAQQPPLLTSPSLGQQNRYAVVMGMEASSEFIEEGHFISQFHGAGGTEEFHRRFSVVTELDSGGGKTVLVSPKPRRTVGGNTSRGSCVSVGYLGDGLSGRSPQGPSGAGSLANSMQLPVLTAARGLSGGLGSHLVIVAAAAAAATVSACLSPRPHNSASRSAGGSVFTRNSTSSSVEDADECDWACGVCLEDCDFIAMLPCNHKICGV